MMNRFLEIFRYNAAARRRDTVASDFEALRRANYDRDDAERAAGVDFAKFVRKTLRPSDDHRPMGGRGSINAAPAEPERR